MKDFDIRRAVHEKILKEHHKDPHTLVVDEFSINLGASRADIAVINGIMHGYELKSERDTLERLPSQVIHYSSVMDKVTLVIAESHKNSALNLIPSWWGVKVAVQGKRNAIHLRTERVSQMNPSHDKLSLAMLLWKSEILSILSEHGLIQGVKSKPKRILWIKLTEVMEMRELRYVVRETIKSRKDWRSGSLP